MSFEAFVSIINVDSWFDVMTRATLAALLVGIVFLGIDRWVNVLKPNQRSWMWRLFYLKIATVILLPYSLFHFQVPNVARFLPNQALELKADSSSKGSDGKKAINGSSPTGTIVTKPLEVTRVANEQGTASLLADPATVAQSSTGFIANYWKGMLFTVWLVVVVVLLTKQVIAHRKMSRLIRVHRATTSTRIPQIYRSLGKDLRLRSLPVLTLVDLECSPSLFFDGKMRVVMPVDFEEQFGEEACRVALVHELAHFFRRDLYWIGLANILSTLFFFLPIMRWVAQRNRTAYESACDAIAIDRGRMNRQTYANLLIQLLDRRSQTVVASTMIAMAGSESFRTLSARLNAMKRMKNNGGWFKVISLSAASLLIASMLVPWTFADDKETKKSKKNSKKNQAVPTYNEGSANATSPTSSGGSSSGTTVTGFAFGSSGGGASAGGSSGGSGTAFGSASGGGSVTITSQSPTPSSGSRASSNTSSTQPPAFARSFGSGATVASTGSGEQITREIVADEDGRIGTVKVLTKTEEITIEESSEDGIQVRIRNRKKGLKSERRFEAETRDELAEKHPEAFKLVKKYAPDSLIAEELGATTTSGENQMTIVVGSDGNVLTNDRSVVTGGVVTSDLGVPGQVMSPVQATDLLRQQLTKLRDEATDPVLRDQFQKAIDQIGN